MVITFEQLLAQRDRQANEGRASEGDTQSLTFNELMGNQETNTNDTESNGAPSNYITFEEHLNQQLGDKESMDEQTKQWLEGTGLGEDVYTLTDFTKEQLEKLHNVFRGHVEKVSHTHSPFMLNESVMWELSKYMQALKEERKIKEMGLFKEVDLDLGEDIEVNRTLNLNL